MLTVKNLKKISKFLDANFPDEYYITFTQGFTDVYIIVEPIQNNPEGREIFKAQEILSER